MKFPKEIRTYCPFCKKHTKHKCKNPSKGKSRSIAEGNRKHEQKLKGHGGKRAGEKIIRKQGKRQRAMLLCSECGKKHVRTIGTRTKKRIEFV